MSSKRPKPDLHPIIDSFGDAGQRLCEMGAAEGAGGNLSVCLLGAAVAHPDFSETEIIDLPLQVPAIAGAFIVVTGSGTRAREIARAPGSCLAILEVQPGGDRALMRYSQRRSFARITSEFNSHLAVHYEHVLRSEVGYHAVVHAQPRKLTYLSHISEYQSEDYLNRRLFRWQPETVLNLPNGISVLPFEVPSSNELMQANLAGLRDRRAAVWAKHGIMTRSCESLAAAVDLVDYLEAAADYECLDLALGQRAQGLDESDLRRIRKQYGVT